MLLCEQKAQSTLCRVGALWALSLFSFCVLSATGQAAITPHAASSVSAHTAGSTSHETSVVAL